MLVTLVICFRLLTLFSCNAELNFYTQGTLWGRRRGGLPLLRVTYVYRLCCSALSLGNVTVLLGNNAASRGDPPRSTPVCIRLMLIVNIFNYTTKHPICMVYGKFSVKLMD